MRPSIRHCTVRSCTALLSLFPLLCWIWPLSAAEPSRDEILQQIRLLADPARREEAAAWLLWHEQSAAPVLREVHAQSLPAVQRDIMDILQATTPASARAHRPDQPESLRVTLSANKSVVAPGETVTFTTTITSTIDEPRNLYLGFLGAPPETPQVPLATCVGPDGLLMPYASHRRDPVCCTFGHYHRFAILAPGRSFVSVTPAVFAPAPAGMPAADLTSDQQPDLYLLGGRRSVRLKAPPGATHRFVAVYQVEQGPPSNTKLWRGWDPTARVWKGHAMSNEVVISVTR